jgi:hypothetical protein
MGRRNTTLEINKILYFILSGYSRIHMSIVLTWIL